MIFKTTITNYIGNVFKGTGEHVINTDLIAVHKADGSTSTFLYTDRWRDRRSKPMPAYSSSTVSEIQAAMDSTLNSNRMTLNVFPGDDVMVSTVAKYINYSDFIYAKAYRKNDSYSLVTFIDGFKISRAVVDNTLDELVVAAEGVPGESPLSPWKFYRGSTTDWIILSFSTDIYPAGSPQLLYTGSTPDVSSFSLSGITGNPTILSITFQDGDTELILNLSGNISIGDSVLVSYVKASPYLLDSNMLAINDFTDEPVIIDN